MNNFNGKKALNYWKKGWCQPTIFIKRGGVNLPFSVTFVTKNIPFLNSLLNHNLNQRNILNQLLMTKLLRKPENGQNLKVVADSLFTVYFQKPIIEGLHECWGPGIYLLVRASSQGSRQLGKSITIMEKITFFGTFFFILLPKKLFNFRNMNISR